MSKYKIKLSDTDISLTDCLGIQDGETKRFTHIGCSNSPNGAAYRSGSGITLKCFKCGDSGYKFLSTPSLYPDVREMPRRGDPDFKGLRRLELTGPGDRLVREYLGKYGLAGVSSQVLVDDVPNPKRAIFTTIDMVTFEQNYCIRNLDPEVTPKWMNVFKAGSDRIFESRQTFGTRTDQVMIVEDPVSAIKLTTVTGIDSIALLGLNLSGTVLGKIVEQYKMALVWTDQDWAGITRGVWIRDGLQACIPTIMLAGLEGVKDPKDHSFMDIRKIVFTGLDVLKEETKDGWK